jgi:pimeloyl-ACP methyl ester carboxylesterase
VAAAPGPGRVPDRCGLREQGGPGCGLDGAGRQRSVERPQPGLGERRQAAIRTHDCPDQLGAVSAPTRVLNGTDDPLVPATTVELLAEPIPRVVLELIEAGRHGLTLEQRDVTAALRPAAPRRLARPAALHHQKCFSAGTLAHAATSSGM